MGTQWKRVSGRARYLRLYAGAVEELAERLPDGSEVHVWRQDGKWVLLAFAGTAGTLSAHVSYRDQGRALAAARQWVAGRRAWAEHIAARRRERTAYRTTLEPGRILKDTWGYEQTNVDYYQVVAVSASRRTVTIRKIAARSLETGWLRGDCWPLADQFLGPPMVKIVSQGETVKIHDWGSWASPWEPKADHWTAYA